MDLVLVIAFLVPFISCLILMRFTLKIKNILSYIIPCIIALVITEIAYVFETMFRFG